MLNKEKLDYKDLCPLADYLENNQDSNRKDFLDFIKVNQITVSEDFALKIYTQYFEINPKQRLDKNFNIIEFIKALCTS